MSQPNNSNGNQQKGNQQNQGKQQNQNNNNGGGTQQNEQGKEAAKVNSEFERNVLSLTALLGGPEGLVVVKKVPGSELQVLVADLFKEEAEATALRVKAGLKALIIKNATFDKEIEEQKKALEKFILGKKKEFNGEARALFAQINGVDDIVKSFSASFKSVSTEVADENQETE